MKRTEGHLEKKKKNGINERFARIALGIFKLIYMLWDTDVRIGSLMA